MTAIPDEQIVPTLLHVRAMIWAAGWVGDPFALLRRGAAEPPYPLYENLRTTAGPVSVSALTFAVVVSHELGAQVLRDPTFGLRINAEEPLRCRLESSYLGMHPGDAARVRDVVAPELAPDRIAALRPRVGHLCAALLDGVDTAAGFDLVGDVADRLATAVLAEFLAVPEDERALFAEHCPQVSSLRDPLLRADALAQVTHTEALRALFGRVVDAPAETPGPGLLGRLVAAHRDGLLTREEAVGAAVMVSAVVAEIGTSLLANAVLALGDRPDLWARLATEPALADRVVAETFRYDAPVQVEYRFALPGAELVGQPVPPGTPVAVVTGAANRDPQVFADPATFDPDRSGEPAPLGADLPGAGLSALLAASALTALAGRMPTIACTGRVKRRRWEANVRAVRRLPVAVRQPDLATVSS